MYRMFIFALFSVPAFAADLPVDDCFATDGTSMYFFDYDGDGYGVPGGICLAEPTGLFTASNGLDTDDDDAKVHPGQPGVRKRPSRVRVEVHRSSLAVD
ncbi:MAG: hypothetical protein ACI9MC_003894 [Kiritimatiellia bacterium]|jgi:hypothetical protein